MVVMNKEGVKRAAVASLAHSTTDAELIVGTRREHTLALELAGLSPIAIRFCV